MPRTRLSLLDQRQHRLDERGLRLVVARRVILPLGDLDDLDDAIDDVHRGALAAHRVRAQHAVEANLGIGGGGKTQCKPDGNHVRIHRTIF